MEVDDGLRIEVRSIGGLSVESVKSATGTVSTWKSRSQRQLSGCIYCNSRPIPLLSVLSHFYLLPRLTALASAGCIPPTPNLHGTRGFLMVNTDLNTSLRLPLSLTSTCINLALDYHHHPTRA